MTLSTEELYFAVSERGNYVTEDHPLLVNLYLYVKLALAVDAVQRK